MESSKAPKKRDSRLRQVTARDRGARKPLGKKSAPIGRGTARELCHFGALSNQVVWPG